MPRMHGRPAITAGSRVILVVQASFTNLIVIPSRRATGRAALAPYRVRLATR
jgi:hypothetical protein